MANGGGRGRKIGSSSGQQKWSAKPHPQTFWINKHVLVTTYLLMAVTGLGYLALTWSTVVLLGGFVSSLQREDFWCLTLISMMQAARIFNDLGEHLIPNFVNIVTTLFCHNIALGRRTFRDVTHTFRQRRFLAVVTSRYTWSKVASLLFTGTIALPFWTLCHVPAFLYGYGPVACIVLASYRIVKHDYGSTDGDASKSNLMPALVMFYVLILCQGALYLAWLFLDYVGVRTFIYDFHDDCKLPNKGWCRMSLVDYLLDTRARCWRDPASIRGRTVLDFAVDLLDSGSWEDNFSGARLLDAFIRQGVDVRSLLLPSRPKIQKMIDTLGWRRGPTAGATARETKEVAARIMAHLASDIHLAQFPGAIQCISSLLQDEISQMYWNSNQQQGESHIQTQSPPEKNAMLGLFQSLRKWSMENVVDNQGDDVHNELTMQGLTILERLASNHQNCDDICKAPGLLSKITAPLYTTTLIHDIEVSSAWADVVNGSFKVIHQLIRGNGNACRSLSQEISSNKQALTNLDGILYQGNRASQELQMGAMAILTRLAKDRTVDLAMEIKEGLIKKQLQIFLDYEEEEEPDIVLKPFKALAGRTLAFLSSNSVTNSAIIMGASDGTVGRLTKMLHAQNNITYRIIAGKILENLCTHCKSDEEMDKIQETLLPLVLRELLFGTKKSHQSNSAQGEPEPGKDAEHQGNSGDEENQNNSVQGDENAIQDSSSLQDQLSDGGGNEEETDAKELQEAVLSLALVICDKLSAEDFHNAVKKNTQEHVFVAKLKTIVDKNCQATANSLRIVKLCGQIAVLIMRCNQYTAHFKDQEFMKSFSEASKIMSNLESCMLFAGKSARPLLADLEKKALELVG